MALRSFKTLNSSDIPALIQCRELHDSANLPANLRPNNWLGSANAPPLSRSGLTVSPDGVYVAWISRGKCIRILDWKKSQQYHLRGEDVDENAAVQRYLDESTTIEVNKVILSISFGKLDAASRRRCARPLNENFHKVLNFPSDSGHIIAAGYAGGEIDLWQVSTKTRIISLVDHKGPVRDVRFAPNGSLLLLSSSSDGCLKLWDCQDDGNLLKTLKPLHTTHVRAPVFAWSADASSIAGTGNSTIVAWDVADISVDQRKCAVTREFHGHQNFVNVCGFSPDGSLLISGAMDCMLILWSTADASILRIFRTVYPCASPFAAKEIGGRLEAFAILDVTFHPQGDHVTAVCADGTARVWSIVDESDDPLAAALMVNNCRPAGCVVFDDPVGAGGEAKIVVATDDGSILSFMHPLTNDPIPSLQHLARRIIRKQRQRFDANSLNVPTRIRRFLNMKELTPELVECDCESRYHNVKIGRSPITNALVKEATARPASPQPLQNNFLQLLQRSY